MTGALDLRQVTKVYGCWPTEVRALSKVDLAVERGELVAIMGPSGSGKSTLLTIAGSLEEATSGQVLVDGVDLAGVSRSEKAKMRRQSIGYVFQDFNLLPGLTAVENVTLPLELDGVRAKAARATGLEAMEELGVAGHAERYADELSGGERQRVAIARAIVGQRGLLLADEPTGALDSVNGEAVMRLLRAAAQRGALALLGALLGVAGAYVALVATYHDDLAYLSRIPVLYLVLLVVGVPWAAIAAGWLLSGREPPAMARPAIE
jgi:putative ABC transport system ATP-binding protein